MWKNYWLYIPLKYHDNILHMEPTPEIWAEVKSEKIDSLEFWATQKVKKYAGNMKDRMESITFGDDGVFNTEDWVGKVF